MLNMYRVFFATLVVLVWATESSAQDPLVMTARAAIGSISVDGRLDEPDWTLAKPYLKFGPSPTLAPDERGVTSGELVRGTYSDTSHATVKFLRKGMSLYIGIWSPDKSVGKFGDSWEGDGLFMKISNAAGTEGEFKLYYNDDARRGTARADSAVYEIGGPFRPTFGRGIGLVASGTLPYDTTQVDNGYTLELEIRLDSLGFGPTVDSLKVMINIFDPDGYHQGSQPWVGPVTRAFHKTWWGTQWGPANRTIYLEPLRPYDDPSVMAATRAAGTIVVDGRLNEPDWANAKRVLKFGPNPQVGSLEHSVTNGALVRGAYWDPSYATAKFLWRDRSLFIGVTSEDKSVGRFGDSWEGDGLFMKIRNAAGTEGEFKLYYNDDSRRGTARADSAVYEIGGPFRPTFGRGVGLVATGTVPYDTTQVDNGYTLELEIRLDSLGFSPTVDSLKVMINIFDPDGYHQGSQPWVGPVTRAFHKTWWGSEWGPTMRTINLSLLTSAEDDPPLPITWSLSQNYPNPFNPSTVIQYSIPQAAQVSLKVYNVLGQELATLVEEGTLPGVYTVRFNSTGLASGLYFYRLQAGSFVETKKMLLIR